VKVRTDVRRRAIVKAAAATFLEAGYEGATMAAISARVGGSKATIYGYFKSKEELYAAVMLEAMDDHANRVFAMLATTSGDIVATLTRFARAYLDFTLSPGIIALTRAGITEGTKSDLGRILYERGPKAGWDRVVAFIEQAMRDGRLRPADPRLVAHQLKGLLEAGLFEPQLFGAKPLFGRRDAAAAAVSAFVRAYEPGAV
jgi:AcrR family transcriptional regulator